MSLLVNKENIYFLPSTNKNGLSTAAPTFMDDGNKSFEFIVTGVIDLDEYQRDTNYGVVMLNGKHLGISVADDYIVGTFWTEKGVKQIFCNTDIGKEFTAHLKCDVENNTIYFNGNSVKIDGRLLDDYKYSYLWVGCASAINDESEWNCYGVLNYIEIIKDNKTIFKSNLKEKTEFKVFDESENGNHLLKYSKEWFD